MTAKRPLQDRFTHIKRNLKKLPKAKQEVANKLVSKLEFMNEELNNLQETLKEKGWVEEYQNGQNQHGFKKSVEADVYNSMVKNFTNGLKTLNEMLPQENEEDELEKWLK